MRCSSWLVMGGLLMGACSPRAAAPPAPMAESSAPASTPDAGATAASRMPPAARRASPPPGLEARALPVGAGAPAFTLPSSLGGTWSLPEALRRGPVVLVFYRGAW